MARLEERVRKLEAASQNVDLNSMTDDELHEYAEKHWKEPPWGSDESVAACLVLALRHNKPMPVVPCHLLPPYDEDFL